MTTGTSRRTVVYKTVSVRIVDDMKGAVPEENVMAMNDKTVSYRTPMGRFDTWEAAANACERADLDPCTCIVTEVSPTDVSHETAYGTTVRLSRAIRVY